MGGDHAPGPWWKERFRRCGGPGADWKRGDRALCLIRKYCMLPLEEFDPVAIRKKRDASLTVAMRMRAENEVDAVAEKNGDLCT